MSSTFYSIDRCESPIEESFFRHANRALLNDAEIIPQFPALRYRLDFLVQGRGRRVGVECDGHRWHLNRGAYDARRDREIVSAGIVSHIHRFTGRQLYNSPAACILRLAELEPVLFDIKLARALAADEVEPGEIVCGQECECHKQEDSWRDDSLWAQLAVRKQQRQQMGLPVDDERRSGPRFPPLQASVEMPSCVADIVNGLATKMRTR